MHLVARILAATATVIPAAVVMILLGAFLFLNLIIVNVPVLALFLLITFPASIGVHELGHLLAGRLVRFRAVSMRVWPFTIYLQGPKLLFQISGWPMLPLGFVQATPNGLGWFRTRWAAFIFGGPCASILVGMALIVPALLVPDPTFYSPFPKLNPLLRELPFHVCSGITLAALWNLLLGLMTLTPSSKPEGGYLSDGTYLIDSLFNHPRLQRLHAQFRLTADLHAGIRPRDWDADAARQLTSRAEGAIGDILARQFAYYHAKDLGQTERAQQLMNEALTWLSKYPSVSIPALIIEGAYLAGFHQRDALMARQLLLRAGTMGFEMQTRLRAEAAVAMAEGNIAQAIALAEAGLAIAPFSTDPGGKMAEIDWLKELLAECRRLAAKT